MLAACQKCLLIMLNNLLQMLVKLLQKEKFQKVKTTIDVINNKIDGVVAKSY